MSEPLHNWAPDRQAWLQGIFDTGVKGLLRQAAKSTNGWFCQYRGPNDNKCALGFSIPDERYNHEWDENATSPSMDPAKIEEGEDPLTFELAGVLGAIDDTECVALVGFQDCHDSAHSTRFIPTFTTRAMKFAAHHNLNTDVFQEGTTS